MYNKKDKFKIIKDIEDWEYYNNDDNPDKYQKENQPVRWNVRVFTNPTKLNLGRLVQYTKKSDDFMFTENYPDDFRFLHQGDLSQARLDHLITLSKTGIDFVIRWEMGTKYEIVENGTIRDFDTVRKKNSFWKRR